MRRWGTFVVGLLVGGVLTGTLLWVGILGVPPPSFTGASFGNNTTDRTVVDKAAKVYFWVNPNQVPPAADRGDIRKWQGYQMAELRASDPNMPYHHAVSLTADNIVAVALVVEATYQGAQETYINFIPDMPFDSSLGITSVVGSLESAPQNGAKLQGRVFYGQWYWATDQVFDDSFLKK